MSPLNVHPPEPPAGEEPRRAEPEPRDRRYWRSLERLLDSPAMPATAASGEEFPAGASDPPSEVDRRTFLTLMAASFGLAGATACRRPEEAIVPYVEGPEARLAGVPKLYATTITRGRHAYPVVVESYDGRPVKIEGNAAVASSGGAADAWTQASILGLYDPERSHGVSRRGEVAAAGADADPAVEGVLGETEEGHPPTAADFAARDDATWDDFAARWRELAAELEASGGAGLAVLAEPTASPTIERLAEELRRRFPGLRWITWEGASDEASVAGVERATGRAAAPLHHLERAAVVAALDADLLGRDPEAVRNARGWAERRRVASPADSMSRLYAVESTMTLTGAAADHRLALAARRIPAFAAALAAELGVASPGARSAAALPEPLRRAAAVMAEDLRAAGGEALVAAGATQPAAVHALVAAINRALGAVGTTVTYPPLPPLARSDSARLARLVDSLAAGEVRALVILGGNPVHGAAADLGLARALGEAGEVIHLGERVDETSALATWHLPLAHDLEAWGDASGAGGEVLLAQPLIEPLFGGRSKAELLALLAGIDRPGRELLRDTWSALSEQSWRQGLHDGVLEDAPAAVASSPALAEVASAGAADETPGGEAAGEDTASEPPPSAVSAGGATADDWPEDPQPGEIELVFTLDHSLHDGRFANNGWLQELPDPITKITWDNAALIAPATAVRLGVEDGDRVRLTLGERSLEAPVFVLPGQAEGSLALALGYGRAAAGRIGNGVGADAARLRTAAAPWVAGGLVVERAGGGGELVQTQEHWSMEGRPLVREATLAHFREHPDFAHGHEAGMKLESLWDEPPLDGTYQWGMTVDLNACTGCNACVVACQSENNVPIVGKEQVARGREMHWLRIDRYFAGDPAAPEVVFQPVPCMHCENAPCEQVCPVAATVHDREGLNAMVYNRCIGTRYCSNNCPYKVRRFNFFNFTKATPELMKMAMNPDVTVRSRGVMEKCTYCTQRIQQAKIAARRDGRRVADGEIKTACQQTCPTDAIVFGDVSDPDTQVSKLKAQQRNYVLLGELNNRPRTSFLAKLRNPNPEWPLAAGDAAAHGDEA